MPTRKHHTEATGGPASEMQKHCSCYLMTLNASLSLCPLILIDMAVLFSAGELKEASLKKWTPQRVRNTRRQPMSAMVSICVLYFHTLLVHTVFHGQYYLGMLLFSRNGVCRHNRHRTAAHLVCRAANQTYSRAKR